MSKTNPNKAHETTEQTKDAHTHRARFVQLVDAEENHGEDVRSPLGVLERKRREIRDAVELRLKLEQRLAAAERDARPRAFGFAKQDALQARNVLARAVAHVDCNGGAALVEEVRRRRGCGRAPILAERYVQPKRADGAPRLDQIRELHRAGVDDDPSTLARVRLAEACGERGDAAAATLGEKCLLRRIDNDGTPPLGHPLRCRGAHRGARRHRRREHRAKNGGAVELVQNRLGAARGARGVGAAKRGKRQLGVACELPPLRRATYRGVGAVALVEKHHADVLCEYKGVRGTESFCEKDSHKMKR